MEDNTPLILKYRPASFPEVMGHDTQMDALQRAMQSSTCPHSYLFTGPSGIGKTTTARIVADYFKAEVLEVDAASTSGIDSVRDLIEMGQYVSLAGNDAKVIIVDECHALSKAAWQALLKILEEPPPHLYFCLCTTELNKVPETIVTRCYHVALKAIKDSEIEELCLLVCENENWKIQDDVLHVVVRAATGQPRKALSLLQKTWSVPNKDEALRIVALQDASDPVIKLLQELIGGTKEWSRIRPLLEKIDGDDLANGTEMAGRYIMGALMREQKDQKAARIWQLLEALVFPAATFDKRAAFIAAVGRMIWSE